MLVCRENGISHVVPLADPSQAQEMRFEPFTTMAVAPNRQWAVTTHWHQSAALWDAKGSPVDASTVEHQLGTTVRETAHEHAEPHAK